MVGVTGRFLITHRVMDPGLFMILARFLLEFATRQGISYVNVSDGDWNVKRFAGFLSRKIPTCIITRHGMDKQRLPNSQVQYSVIKTLLIIISP